MTHLMSSFCGLFSWRCTSKIVSATNCINKSLFFSTGSIHRTIVLGIETSCDDTGCAIVDDAGRVLGDALNSQQLVHLRNGGIIPPIAQDLHRHCIESVVDSTLERAAKSISDIDAIAVTVKPGLPLSLIIGLKYAKYLSRLSSKPIIPIHHMEAHALMARMEHQVDYPFLVLLISGGHCLLAVVNDVDDFKLLGHSIDDAPGEAFDKTARRMKLRNLEMFSTMSGGPAIELAASLSENPDAFELSNAMLRYRDCNFSMAGLKNSVLRQLFKKEKEHSIKADGVIPEAFDLCAAFQKAVTKHLCQRTQRAMEYVDITGIIPENKRTLVVSGGVACNNYIAKSLSVVCNEMGYKFIRPRPKLCTDNGIMIAWNGIERLKKGIGIAPDIDMLDIQSKCELGESLVNDVLLKDIKCKWIKT